MGRKFRLLPRFRERDYFDFRSPQSNGTGNRDFVPPRLKAPELFSPIPVTCVGRGDEMEQEKPLSTLYYGLVGIAAVGALSIALLGILIAGAPADRFQLTSYDPAVPPSAASSTK
jgi:hypothetical protein